MVGAMRGMSFGLDDETADRVLRAGTDEQLMEVLGDIEDRMWGDGLVLACEVDKAWDPIGCALSPQAYAGDDEDWWSDPVTWPARGVILGDRPLNRDLDAGLITYNDPAHVEQVADFLAGVSETNFRDAYLAMPDALRNPEFGPQECDYAWEWLTGLAEFYRSAARERRHVIFSVNY
ncbi:MAG: DUF1877 family protein [Agromyces sp.]